MTDEISAADRDRQYVRRNRVEAARLANGEPAWPVAERNGISRTAFAMRLKRGVSPDDAATMAMVVRNNTAPKPYKTVGGKPFYFTSDGRAAVDVAREAGIAKVTWQSRVKRGWSVDEAVGLVPPPRGVGTQVRIFLSDGRAAVPVAEANGVQSRTFYHRLKRGLTPDEAAGVVASARPSSDA